MVDTPSCICIESFMTFSKQDKKIDIVNYKVGGEKDNTYDIHSFLKRNSRLIQHRI